ncbi:MAG: hypothetical protein K0S08_2079 [Gammaproteobacteria bacterium]|jgi:preprotein translocase subunit SecD|nr:hypothetical protein [Gammaproteobacteria bacterium]
MTHTNHYPLWKNALLIIVVIFAFIYAIPNLYGEDPAIQISGTDSIKIDNTTLQQVANTLTSNHIATKEEKFQNNNLLIRFSDTDTQLKAKDILKAALGDHYTIALNLVPSTPAWLQAFGATPMKLGLDLRGGIHFTLDVDADSVITQRLQGMQHSISDGLREQDIRYIAINKQDDNSLWIAFRDEQAMSDARAYLSNHYREFQIIPSTANNRYTLTLKITPQSINDMRQMIMDQTMTTLRNRVNELGISEATVQQAGENRIAVEMPGVLDSARAKQILGGTATVEFRMVDIDHDPRTPVVGSTPYPYEGSTYLLKNQVILSGSSITDAQASTDDSGRPAVSITLGGGGEALFQRTTAMNIGKPMSIVYVEPKLTEVNDHGHITKVNTKTERIISVATIRSALPNTFQITGLGNAQESQNLALLLRAGALPATMNIVEERTLGPKLGMENIDKGVLSIKVGMAIVILFMALYYRVFGLIADIGIFCNMLLLVALLSALGMTLTLPGLAGIVLTVGMAVDANVLIFERIREELRNGASAQGAILAGYERAFTTIVDANVSTLIVALVLFGIGSGPIKGFAVTLSAGILTSMISSIAITRALVNWIYGRKGVKKLSIGI